MQRLKKRRDFLLAAKGLRTPRRGFVLESRRRDDDEPTRFGFTVSKRVARKAVERNRIRRRLKEVVRLLARGDPRPEVRPELWTGRDYVLVGRRGALRERFAALGADLAGALAESARPKRAAARSSSR